MGKRTYWAFDASLSVSGILVSICPCARTFVYNCNFRCQQTYPEFLMYVSPDQGTSFIMSCCACLYYYGLTHAQPVMIFTPFWMWISHKSCAFVYCTPYLHSACVCLRKWSHSEYHQNRIRFIRNCFLSYERLRLYIFWPFPVIFCGGSHWKPTASILAHITSYWLRLSTSRWGNESDPRKVCARIIAPHMILCFTHSHVCSCARSWEDSVWGDPLQKASSLVPQKFSFIFSGTKLIFLNYIYSRTLYFFVIIS
jgi:hypothetical protein